MATTTAKRKLCERCARPLIVCVCQHLPEIQLDTVNTHVVILQHSNEKKNRQAISSVPLLSQVLTSASTSTFVLDQWTLDEPNERLESIVLDPSIEIVFILFPRVKAKTLTTNLTTGKSTSEQQQPQQEQQKKYVLVALDGTWKEAKQMMHRSQERLSLLEEELSLKGQRLVYVCLDDHQVTAQSCYGALRKEPKKGCISTLEAVAFALQALEPVEKAREIQNALLQAFQGMVSKQEVFMKQGQARSLEYYNGVTKEEAIKAKREQQKHQQQEDAPVGVLSPSPSLNIATSEKLFVLCQVQVDFRHRKMYHQYGERLSCTYDEARIQCQFLNTNRPRGTRLSVFPLEKFHQLLQTQEQD